MHQAPPFWVRLQNRLRYGLATQEVLDRLARIGVVMYPYYLVYEPIVMRPEIDALGDGLQFKLLERNEAAALITAVVERPRAESEIRESMDHASCVAVMENDELLAYTWFTRQQIRIPASANALSELPPHWGYLFDMYVRPKARGCRLAVHMRHRVHRLLAEQGVTHCCSISLTFNRSSRRFKAKLGSIEAELRLLLRLGPFPGLDLRLWRRPWSLQTPVLAVAHAVQRARR